MRVAEAVAGNLQAEISAGDRLRDLLQPRRWVGHGRILLAWHICMAQCQLTHLLKGGQPDCAGLLLAPAACAGLGVAACACACSHTPAVKRQRALALPSRALPPNTHLTLPPVFATTDSGGMGVEELSDAIRAAERYPSLAAEVEAARGLRERWRKRAEAQVGGLHLLHITPRLERA